jgi:hypothetical protein
MYSWRSFCERKVVAVAGKVWTDCLLIGNPWATLAACNVGAVPRVLINPQQPMCIVYPVGFCPLLFEFWTCLTGELPVLHTPELSCFRGTMMDSDHRFRG